MASVTKYFYCGNEDINWETNDPNEAAYSLTFTWEVTNQNVVSNTSTINWSLKASAEARFTEVPSLNAGFGEPSYIRFGTDATYAGIPYDDILVKLGWEEIYNKTDLVKDLYKDQKDLLLDSGTFTVTHDDNGNYSSKTISCSVRVKNIYDANGKPGYAQSGEEIDLGSLPSNLLKVSGTLIVNPIPRYAVILSAPESFTDEDSPTITFAIPSGATNVRAYIALNTGTVDIGPYAVSGSSYTFNFTEAEKAKLWRILDQGLTTKQVYFYVSSEFNGTLYHSNLISALEVINYTPVINPNVNDIYDTNEAAILLTGDKHKLIRYVSNAYYNIGAEGRKGATISGASIKNGELTKYSITGTFEGVTSPIFEYTATDNRGYTIPLTITDLSSKAGYWIPYIKITASLSVTEMTADGDVQVKIIGKCFNGGFGNKTNRLRISYDISKNKEEPTHVDLGYADNASNHGNSFSVNGSDYTYILNLTGLDYQSVYDLTVKVSDEVMVEGTAASTVIAARPIFDWSRKDFNFNVPVTIQGGSVPTIMSQGKTGIWTYRTWSDGTAECWGKKDFTVNVTSQWGSMYTSGAISGSNISFPSGLFVETPVVNASLLVRSAGGILMAPEGAGDNTASTTQTGVYEIARGTSLNNAAYTINYNVKGKWKN